MVLRLPVIRRGAIKIPRARFVFLRAVLGFQQSARADVARHASRRKGAARKAEDIDLDPFLVLLRQKPVSTPDVVAEPCTCGSAENLVPRGKPGPDTVVVIDPLVLDPIGGFELWIDQIPYTNDVGDLLAVVSIPCTIEAQNQPFEHVHGISPPPVCILPLHCSRAPMATD